MEPNAKNTGLNNSKNVQKKPNKDLEDEESLLKMIAEIIVEIIIKETTHGSNRIYPKEH